MTDEMLRTLAYVAAQERQGTVNYVTLQSDIVNTRAKNSILQELGTCMSAAAIGISSLHAGCIIITAGRDIHSYIEQTATKLVHNKQSQKL